MANLWHLLWLFDRLQQPAISNKKSWIKEINVDSPVDGPVLNLSRTSETRSATTLIDLIMYVSIGFSSYLTC